MTEPLDGLTIHQPLPRVEDSLITIHSSECPPGIKYLVSRETTGSLAEHPEVIAAFEAGARRVFVTSKSERPADGKDRTAPPQPVASSQRRPQT